MNKDQEEAKEKATKLLVQLGWVLPVAVQPRQWDSLSGGFGHDVSSDLREAEGHMRAPYRIIACNQEVQ